MQAEMASQDYLERLLMLRTFPGFGTINPGAISLMAERSRYRRFQPGEAVYVEGKPVTHLYFVIEGAIAVRRGGVIVSRVGYREVLGALSAFAHSNDGPEAVAESETWTLEIENRDTNEVFQDNFDMLQLALAGVCRDGVETRRLAGPSAGYSAEFCPMPAPSGKLRLVDRIEYLAGSILFPGARLDKLALLARECREVRFKEGEALWKEGDPSGNFFIPLTGAISCRTPSQAFFCGAGEAVGLIESLGGVPRWFDAEAASPTVGLELHTDLLLDVYEDDTVLGMRLLAKLSSELIGIRRTFAEVVYLRNPGWK